MEAHPRDPEETGTIMERHPESVELIGDFIDALIDDPDSQEGLLETPRRVARMWHDELTSGYRTDIEKLFKTFPDEGYSGMVMLTDVPVTSTCEHHMVPFVGYAHIAYFPDGRVVGLSKLPRLVDAFSRRLQVQERLTQQVHDAIEQYLTPRGAIVVVEAEHLCMTLRGIQKPGTKTMTCSVSGLFRDPAEGAREEFFTMLRASNGGNS